MGRLVDDCLIKYNLKECLFAITPDNASNNKTLHQHVAGICNTFEQGYHMPCLAHVIQLAVKELLTNINSMHQMKTLFGSGIMITLAISKRNRALHVLLQR